MPVRLWNQLFFQSVDVRQYAILRIGLGSMISFYLIGFIALFADHFGPEGWLGSSGDLDLYHAGSWSVLFLTGSEAQAWIFIGVTLVGALFFTLGLLTRWCGFILLIGLISIWNRNPLLMDGDDAILRIMLFYLLLSPCGNALALDSRWRHRSQRAEIWPLRMIQIQLALIYFISGWVKFHSPEWLNGSILQYLLIHPEYSRWNWNDLIDQPVFRHGLQLISTLIMWWEILFPILILLRITRPCAIAIGLIFHGGLLIFMHLRLFSPVMLILYIAWIPARCFDRANADDVCG